MIVDINKHQAEEILRKYFKIDHFYQLQWETISYLFRGERILLIEKTGYGKSLCFQFPAILYEGLTVIFSPLIALMRDQVKKLQTLGIAAKCINSNQSPEENDLIIDEAKKNQLKILYIAPERQENYQWIEEIRKVKLSMVVVDEAHCISVWGHDFRPAYRRIVNLVNLLPKGMPVLATTATATKIVENDISTQITGDLKILRGKLMRDNFRLFVINVTSDEEKLIWLGQNVDKLPGTGIVYTGTVANTEIISRWFEYLDIPARSYSSRIDSVTRIEIENGLLDNQWKCVVSTNALGMGIDKPDIRYIIHTQFPQSPVHYYQEIGRAGRDGEPTYIILLYNKADRSLPEAFIEGGKPAISKYYKVIEALKNELLGERELMRKTNLRQTQLRVIKADLIDQGIIREVLIGKSKKYEYIPDSRPLDSEFIDKLKKTKYQDMESMIRYAETGEPRMHFLCNFLGDQENREYHNCDNSGLKKHVVKNDPEWQQILREFRENYFPRLKVASHNSNLTDGVAASYYGMSNVGSAIHRSKYENGGDFPDFLVSLMIKAYYKKLSKDKFDLILYVPPSVSGDLVKNLAQRVSFALKIPMHHILKKSRPTRAQKIFENHILKSDNVNDAFIIDNPELIKEKKILLIDDVLDSGATIKEIGKYLTNCGASLIVPLVLAKTVGGDTL